MPDNPEMSATQGGWADVVPEIVRHIVAQLNPLLPPGLALLATGSQVVLSTTGQAPQVVGTQAPRLPQVVDRRILAEVAADVLDDVQDLIISHIATPWPVTKTGKSTHASSDLAGASLALRFSSRDGSDSIELQPYEVPAKPPNTSVAG
ncbi:MAG: hypothetical protein ACRDXB_12925 [Actinomycetes bacterium]